MLATDPEICSGRIGGTFQKKAIYACIIASPSIALVSRRENFRKIFERTALNPPYKRKRLMSTPEYAIRFAVVDDDENDCRTLIQLVEKSCEFVCAGTYHSANEALREIPKIRPDVDLMDIRMPGIDGNECTRRLKVIVAQLKIVIITALQDLETVNNSLQAGADGYLTKPIDPAECLAVLRLATRTGPGARIAGVRKTRSLLTDRENEIMALLEDGLLYKEIAHKLGISCSTVHFHLHNIFLKFAAGNRTEAVMRWRDVPRS